MSATLRQALVQSCIDEGMTTGRAAFPASRGSFVYFVQAAATGAVKIGKAIDPKRRLRELQTAQAGRLRLLGAVPGGHGLENTIHRRFVLHRLQGEWFDSSPELLSFVYGLMRSLPARSPNVLAPANTVAQRAAARRALQRTPRPPKRLTIELLIMAAYVVGASPFDNNVAIEMASELLGARPEDEHG